MSFPVQGGQVSGQVGGQAEQLTKRQQAVLKYLSSKKCKSLKINVFRGF